MVQLPTSEDLREYQFPQLVSSTNAQRQAAANLIDALDLTKNDEEKLDPKMTFNPAIQYLNQVLVERINEPDAPLPRINENIADYLKPDLEMYSEAQQEVSAFDEAFKLNEVEAEPEKKRIYWRDIMLQEEKKLEEKPLTEEELQRIKVDGKGG